VTEVSRRGKWLRIALDRGSVFSHLGMTGRWSRAEEDEPSLPHERVRLRVSKGRERYHVRYTDPRLFGRFVPASALPAWSALGPDALVDGIDPERLFAGLSRRKIAVKVALLDQELLAGIGNIQAQEALFFAKLDPERPSASLSRDEVGRLVLGLERTLRRTLGLAIAAGPRLPYVEEKGTPNPFVIYGRAGTPCPECGTTLEKLVQSARSTVRCPRCQPARPQKSTRGQARPKRLS
jgi:formamidopyrimidine-DNA glycosylase